jgi:hypothetical protein
VRFGQKSFLWRLRGAGTPWRLECARLITPAQVSLTTERGAGFGWHTAASGDTPCTAN